MCVFGGDVFLYPSSQPKKRPDGIGVIAVLWTLVSIYNIYVGLNTIIVDLGVLPYLSDPRMPEWYWGAIPVEIMIGFFVVAYGFLTLLVVYGLWTGRSWSYDFALALPLFIIILNSASMVLYMTAPRSLGLEGAVFSTIPFIAMNLVWLVGLWIYLMKPHVRQYLNIIPTPPPTPVPVPPSASTLSLPRPPEPVSATEGKRFCRYCGVENKTDAVFCEKCGKKIG